MRDDLYSRVRSREVLHRAWAAVKASGLASASEATVRAIVKFDENSIANIERLYRRLHNESFSFDGERGVTVPKKKGAGGFRPLVVAPIENRIARRAILEVLQGFGDENAPARRRWGGVAAVREVMSTRTSVGGIPERGVPYGLALIVDAVREDKPWFVRSDIKSFFTRIPLADVNKFISDAVPDRKFVQLFSAGLSTNLANQAELEERRAHLLFPDAQVGVAQGSALSALAGNIALREFDRVMNDRDVVCVRYIDDFILLAPSRAKALAAYRSARKLLADMGMDVYETTDAAALADGKVDAGNIFDGTDVLGYRVSGRSLQPSAKAEASLLAKLDKIVQDAEGAMRSAVAGVGGPHSHLYHQSMVLLHKTLWGWSQSFRHTTAQQAFAALDARVSRRIDRLQAFSERLTAGAAPPVRRRIMGIHNLADTAVHALPPIAAGSRSQSRCHG